MYPSIILSQGLYPKNIGPKFLDVYKSIVERRLKAKKEGNKSVADSLKLIINSSFGLFGCPYSRLYSPELLIQVTISGQLILLGLIERLSISGIRVVSANTDGVTVVLPESKYLEVIKIIKEWDKATGLTMEETRYKSIYIANVNNYVAIKEKGFKSKGAYASGGLSKNPSNLICIEAVINLLSEGVPIRNTIESCRDIRKFVTVRKVTKGAMYNGEDLGKSIRFYYSLESKGCITVGDSKVPKTDGSKPLMELPEEFPSDVNFQRYEIEAQGILNDIGWSQQTLF